MKGWASMEPPGSESQTIGLEEVSRNGPAGDDDRAAETQRRPKPTSHDV
jgi:hypothetical protein